RGGRGRALVALPALPLAHGRARRRAGHRGRDRRDLPARQARRRPGARIRGLAQPRPPALRAPGARPPPAPRRLPGRAMTTALPFAPSPLAPAPARIATLRDETANTFTITLEGGAPPGGHRFAPGQFNMLYVFGVGEVPI